MMKVASLFVHPFSESPGSSIRVKQLAMSLGELGIESIIFVPYEKARDIANNVHIIPISNLASQKRLASLAYALSRRVYYSSKLYMANLSIYSKVQGIIAKRVVASVYPRLRDEKVDLLQAEQDVTIAAGLELKKLIQVPLVADIHNLTPLELVSAGIIKEGSETFKHLNTWTGYLLSQVDLIIAVSKEMKAYMVSEYASPESKIIVIPPGGRLGLPDWKRELPAKVVYAGLAAYREHIDLFIRSIPYVHIKRPEVQFYMSKKGEDYTKLMSLAKQVDARITPFWYEDENEFFSFLGSCHIGILPSLNDMARKVGTPLKLFDYLSFGLPIVANDVGAWSDIITEEKVGLVTEDDPQAFASAILKLLNDEELAAECGRRGKELVRTKYNWGNSARRLLDGYRMLLG